MIKSITYRNKNLSFVNRIIFFNFLIESLILITNDRFLMIGLQTLLNLMLFVVFFRINRKIKKHRYLNSIVLILFVYNSILILFSSDIITTINYSTKFLFPLLYFTIGLKIINNLNDIRLIINYIWLYLAYFTIYILIVNVLGIGEEMYKGGLKTGYFSLNGLYIPCFALIFLLFNFNYLETKKKRIITGVFAFTTFLIFVALLKRTLLLLILISFIIYIIKYAQFKKVVLNLIVLSLVFVSVPFFQNNLLKSLESRNSRFNNEYSVTNEGRFTENIIMFNLMKEEPIQLFFGSGEVFNDRKYISKFYEVEREAHNSFIRIFWNGGIVGLVLFLFFYFIQFKILFYNKKYIKNNVISKLLFFTLLLITLRFLNDFSSGITYLSFNAYCYLFIGGVIQITLIQKKNRKIENKNEYLIANKI